GYTAAALSFALRELPVPVIMVGSQRSSDRPSSDAPLNLMSAVAAATYAPFAEVTVAMHASTSDDAVVVHRGTKVRKCHTSSRDAFKSINAKPIASIRDGKVEMLTQDFKPRNPRRSIVVKPRFNEKVALIKSYPGLPPALIDTPVEKGYRGIILEGTGLGHVSRSLHESLANATRGGVVVGMTSQCLWGRTGMTVYDTGRDLLNIGVLPLDDILPETALVKLMWTLGQTADVEEVKRIMLSNLAGEFSEKTTYQP
ncbi:MAG: Glu-tRNA(Gln) amidotransferase subunit GatD, partial [Candidatus Bathyarchaeia archaeon]